ncbi:MAG: hypothetical protein Q9204_007745 [Flavoplaca sp. TL-2023a]
MPLVPSSSDTPTRKEKGTQYPEKTGSSWSRVWIAQHPPKVAKAEVTVRAPSLVAAEEKYPPLSDIEHVSPLHQILPLYTLPSIVELPKHEAHSALNAASPSSPTHRSQKAKMSTIELPRTASVSVKSNSGVPEGSTQENQGTSRMTGVFPLSPIAEAAGIPLPSSPTPKDFPEQLSSDNGEHSAQLQASELGAPTAEAINRASKPSGGENNTWTSRLTSILPDAVMDQPSRQGTGTANNRTSRASSVAPGAYPESDSTEESLKQNQDEPVEHDPPKIDQPEPDEKTIRPRKSVSIVLPGTSNEINTRQEEQEESERLSEEHRDNILSSGSPREIDDEANADQGPKDNAPAKSRLFEEDEDSKASPQQADPEASPEHLQAPTQRDSSVKSRTNSIAASNNVTDRSEFSTLHERESLAPSDADNSSLMPLLSSSPGDARSSHFTESLDDNHAALESEIPLEEYRKTRKEASNPPLTVDDSSSISPTDSPTSSRTAQPSQKRTHDSSSSPPDNGEDASNAASSLPPPKIVVKHATSAEESSQSPSLSAPTTTPIRDGPTLPRRQTTFVALGEPLNDERAIKLPKKGRKLYVRKIRYAILRQPILNAALGRQVGATTKQALKKLSHGELIVIEPPATL